MTRRRTLPEALELAASGESGFTFREAGGKDRFRSYRALLADALRVAGGLAGRGLSRGARVVLIVPEPEDFLRSFFGVSAGGMVAVPVYPPLARGDLATYLKHVTRVALTARASAILTTAPIRRILGSVVASAARPLATLDLAALEGEGPPLREVERPRLEDPAFIQFTSGSTSRPKGVVLTHDNLAANVGAFGGPHGLAAGPSDVGVSWLPMFHDMGLIGMAIGSIYFEVRTTILSPRLFLKRPVEWLRAMSDHRGTITFAPSFAYGLCARRVKDAELAALDLSPWRIAGSGAEPIHEASLLAFARRFAPAGFRREALLPCYGLAEHTLAASFPHRGTGLSVDAVRAGPLREGKAVSCPSEDPGAVRVVSCGRAFPDHSIRIVDDAGAPLPDRVVGEIALAGPSVMRGYEGSAEPSRGPFCGGFLLTGDLGYLSGGELFVCGRKKDVIIAGGKNYHPQDIEWAAADVPVVRRGNVVAFGSGAFGGRERVVVVAESKGEPPGDLDRQIRLRVAAAIGLRVDEVIVVPAGTIPKTSSGKLQRSRVRARWEDGTLLTPRRKSGLLRHLVTSQLGYWRVQLFGPR